MSYVGNTNTTQAFTAAVDYFSGNGSTVAFTLSRPVASTAQVQAVVNNVPQNPTDAFTVLNNTITFTSAPSSGTNNIYVQYTSPITQVIQPGQGTVGAVQLDIAGGAGTGAAKMPVGTTAQRPTGAAGLFRMNTTTGNPEWYDTSTSAWIPFGEIAGSLYSVEYLVVAGGGGGAGGQSNGNGTGGGGAGGFRTATLTLTSATAYTVTVGGGGAAGQNHQVGQLGNNSVFGSVTSIAGGGGATYQSSPSTVNGGSGGGGGGGGGGGPGTGTSGQGNAGGVGFGSNYPFRGGGGGGASAAGATGAASGNGGAGSSSSISGSAVTYAGGGGGGGFTGYGSSGGAGGGGFGSGGAVNGGTGTANTGGGGGGGGWESANWAAGGNGGSGIVIIRYPGAQRGTGGTVTSAGGYTIHTFTSSGTFTA